MAGVWRSGWWQGLAVAGALACAGVAAQDYRSGEIRGVAEVTDGDTLRIGEARIRLFGVDAPERAQSCEDERGRRWACGAAAADRLRALVDGRTVRCQPRDLDRYGRQVATCAAGGRDLGGTLVSEGLARAYVRYGDDYAAVEARAKLERLGLWQGVAEAPWQYRAEKRAAPDFAAAAARTAPEVAPPAGCTIKGNVSGGGDRVFHLPGTAGYARTKIDTGRGDRWFCDEAEARAAGFRAPREPGSRTGAVRPGG